jgi:hypothetical protein
MGCQAKGHPFSAGCGRKHGGKELHPKKGIAAPDDRLPFASPYLQFVQRRWA